MSRVARRAVISAGLFVIVLYADAFFVTKSEIVFRLGRIELFDALAETLERLVGIDRNAFSVIINEPQLKQG